MAAERSAAATESKDPEVRGATKKLERHSHYALVGTGRTP